MFCALSMNVDSSVDRPPKDAIFHDYSLFFENLGINTLYIPNFIHSIEHYFEKLPVEGLVLTGGNDLGKQLTGISSGKMRNTSADRDNQEKKMVSLAIQKRIPIIGICRGMQFLNVYFGGGITHDLSKMASRPKPHVGRTHLVTLKNSRIAAYLGTDELIVNSYHNQGVTLEQLAPPLDVVALCKEDNLVEWLCHETLPVFGIQWHPERDSCPDERLSLLFKDFLQHKFSFGASE